MKLVISLTFFIALSHQVTSNSPQPLRFIQRESRPYPSSSTLGVPIPTASTPAKPPTAAYSRFPSNSSRYPSPSTSSPLRYGSFGANAPIADSASSPATNLGSVRAPGLAKSRSTSSAADASKGNGIGRSSLYTARDHAPVPKPQPTPLNAVKHRDQATAADDSFPGRVTVNGDNGITVTDITPDGRNVIIEISAQGIDQKQYDALGKQFRQAIQMVFYEAKYKVGLLSRVL